MKWPFWTRTQPALLPELDDCEAIDPLLSLYADGMASPNEARRVETHLPGCDSCRELLAWMQATQRALAARPVVRPPAELRARIADAIAAASAAPVPAFGTRPARSFSLRPAYAAAASLTIVGLVSYSLLHHPTPAVHPPVASSPLVAAVPHENASTPTVHPALPNTVSATQKHRPHGFVKPAPVTPALVARGTIEDESPAPAVEAKPSAGVHSAVKSSEKPSPVLPTPRPHLPAVKKPISSHSNSARMATTKIPSAPVETHKAPPVQPEKKPNAVVAAVPQPASSATQTIIEKPIVTQDPPTKVASNHPDTTLGMVNDFARHMRTAELKATVGRSMSHAALATAALDNPDKSGTLPIANGDFH